MLKEIDRKKALIDQARPLPKIIVDKLSEYFTVEWTYTSNAIEGNTLDRAETLAVLKDGATIGGKSLKEHLEAINHKAAITYINEIFTKVEPITQNDIKYLHSLILRGINDRYAGHYRDVDVIIVGAKHIPPLPDKVPALMNDFSLWLVDRQETRDLHPVEFAVLAHYQLVNIHPFIDGNGRTSRLLMNLILMKYGYPIAIIDCEKEPRTIYYHAIRKADDGDNVPFKILVAEYVNKTADIYVGSIPKRG
ncbi:Fic family protein [Candidatus Saganbacteria bacterium]|nr:Fic family protein [Candidatus Saganbacteria bacterium]